MTSEDRLGVFLALFATCILLGFIAGVHDCERAKLREQPARIAACRGACGTSGVRSFDEHKDGCQCR